MFCLHLVLSAQTRDFRHDKIPRHLDGQWEHENLLPPPPRTIISLVPDSEGHNPMRN